MSAAKFFKRLKKKLAFTLILIPNSSSIKVQHCVVPFSLALFIIGFIILNIYIFLGYSTQIWQINAFHRDVAIKSRLITKLYSEKNKVIDSLAKNNTVSKDLNQLIQGQTSLESTLIRVKEKRGRSIFIANRGFFVRTQPYKLVPVQNNKDAVTPLESLNRNLGELDKYLQVEKKAQNKLLTELMAYEYRLDHTPSIWPVHTYIINGFGMRFHPIFKKWIPHLGVDIVADYGTKVAATADGVVCYAGWEEGYGNLVMIDHGNGYQTRYAHNSRIIVYQGQKIKKGQIISLAGATGDATGPHVHYEVRINDVPVNPVPFLQN